MKCVLTVKKHMQFLFSPSGFYIVTLELMGIIPLKGALWSFGEEIQTQKYLFFYITK